MMFRRVNFFFSLYVILELNHRPGLSQVGNTFKHCPECTALKVWQDNFATLLKKHATYKECGNNIVRFSSIRGFVCFDKSEASVLAVMKEIDKLKETTLSSSHPESKPEFSKDSDKKPSTSIVPSTANPDVSTQSRMAESHKPTQADVQTTQKGALTTSPSDPNLNHHLHGFDEKPTTPTVPATTSAANKDVSTGNRMVEKHKPEADVYTTEKGGTTTSLSDANNDRQRGKEQSNKENGPTMKHMQTAIISLIAIILVITTVGTILWCRRRNPDCNLSCEDRHLGYTVTSSEDSAV
ncbi:uncharacterized protein LOC142151174 [Mixophyes fleayi]|uniref:uncharacterized protein LOC142151174 n=1 Tax=Mixophyes fleayi TaxID=3061075 RepID=UPI003F4E23F6